MANEIKSGVSTSEFKMTGVGMLFSATLALLATFNVLTLTPEQKTSLYEFCAVAWMVLPGLYTLGRSHMKASAVKAPDTIMQNKQTTELPGEEAK
jgi:hypothetical protein